MGIFQNLSVVALRQVVGGVCNAVGIGAGGEAVVALLTNHFTDHSQRLTKALQTANERAWKALEIALAGESLWNKLAPAEDQAFRVQVRAFLDVSPFKAQSDEHLRVFKQALQELRAARAKGALAAGGLAPAELARQVGPFASFREPQATLDAEWKLVEQTAGELRELCPNLWRVLVARTKSGSRPSILVVAVRYYFRREIETDEELFRGLAIGKLEALQEGQDKGFAALTEALSRQGDRLEQMLADLSGVVIEIAKTTKEIKVVADEINLRVQGLDEKFQNLLEQLQLQNREVRRSDSLSVRSDGERQHVQRLIAQYRALPEEKRQELPALLNKVGKLEVATGDLEAAQQDFQAVASLTADPKARAEAHHNAYQAALERQQWQDALAALRQAVVLDPVRFAPFPMTLYEPQSILGAGGFGVVFLCRHRHSGGLVVVKSLLASELDRDTKAVFAEAQALEGLDHPGIIRLKHCDYADEAQTRPYLVMDFFDGANLDNFVSTQGPLSPQDLLAVAIPVAEALQAAHARGILHRDVKPANILVRREGERWRVKLIDFGLALRPDTVAGADSTQGLREQTTTGKSIAGTLHYAAPEQMGQLPGVAVGAYSDVYGFGKSCYYALLATSEPDDVERDSLPEPWRKFLGRCTGRRLANRWPDFVAVLAGLAEVRQQASAPVVTVVTSKEKQATVNLEPTGRESSGVSEPKVDGVVPVGGRPLYLKAKGIVATGYEAEDDFVVLAGSQAVKETVPSIPGNLVEKRKGMIQQGSLVAGTDCLILKKDYTFDSASMAAGVLLGRNANGRLDWKDSEGKTLKEIQNAAHVQPVKPTEPEPSREGKEGLRKAQVRILQALLPEGKGQPDPLLTRKEISEKANVDRAWTGSYLTPTDWGAKSGITPLTVMKAVKEIEVEGDSKKVSRFSITATGKKLLDELPETPTAVHTPTTEDEDEEKPSRRKEGLRKPEVRLLSHLAFQKVPISAEMICEGSSTDKVWGCIYLFGRRDPSLRAELETRHGPTLLTRGFVHEEELKLDGGKSKWVYEITAAGREALACVLHQSPSQDETNSPPEQDQAERDSLRKRFWEGLLSRPKAKTTRHANIAAGEYNWIGAGSGVRGVPFNYFIRKEEGQVELYIDRGTDQGEENKRIFEWIHNHKAEIERTFGCELSWQRLDDKRACRIAYITTGGGYRSDESKWPEIQDAMIDAMIRLEKALTPHLANLQTELTSGGG